MISPLAAFALASGAGTAAGLAGLGLALRRRNMHNWLPVWLAGMHERAMLRQDMQIRLDSGKPVHVFIAVCDHYEPRWNRPSTATALARVDRWCEDYPRIYGRYADSDGRPPRHSFFFPQDEYAPEYLDRLAELCDRGFGEVEVHLHHEGETAAELHDLFDDFRHTLFNRHGLLRRNSASGEIEWCFIHGNWALCNSRPDGRWCGVNEELDILRATGCIADLTMPSAPSDTQISTINSIYHAVNQPGRPRSHERGTRATIRTVPPAESLLLIQGPLTLDWQQRKAGLLPRIENGDLHAGRGPDLHRLHLWLDAGVHVVGRPDWRFIKLHTHGCKDGNLEMWLDGSVGRFHEQLRHFADTHPQFHYHYVTAWEMAQLVGQAERGAETPVLPAPVVSAAESLTPA